MKSKNAATAGHHSSFLGVQGGEAFISNEDKVSAIFAMLLKDRNVAEVLLY